MIIKTIMDVAAIQYTTIGLYRNFMVIPRWIPDATNQKIWFSISFAITTRKIVTRIDKVQYAAHVNGSYPPSGRDIFLIVIFWNWFQKKVLFLKGDPRSNRFPFLSRS